MKKGFIVLLIILIACANREYRVTRITHGDTEKTVDVKWGDSNLQDTIFTVGIDIPDNEILDSLHELEDSLVIAKIKADNVYLEFQRDSAIFRQVTRIINGGYNGWDDRYNRWLVAREALRQYTDSINNTKKQKKK